MAAEGVRPSAKTGEPVTLTFWVASIEKVTFSPVKVKLRLSPRKVKRRRSARRNGLQIASIFASAAMRDCKEFESGLEGIGFRHYLIYGLGLDLRQFFGHYAHVTSVGVPVGGFVYETEPFQVGKGMGAADS